MCRKSRLYLAPFQGSMSTLSPNDSMAPLFEPPKCYLCYCVWVGSGGGHRMAVKGLAQLLLKMIASLMRAAAV